MNKGALVAGLVAMVVVPLAAGSTGTAAQVFAFEDCFSQLAILPVPMASVQGLALPAGFAPTAFDPLGQLAILYTHALSCARGSGPGFEAEQVTQKWFTLDVQVPPPLQAQGVLAHLLPLRGASPTQPVVAAFNACGMHHLRAGTATLALLADTGAARGSIAEASDGAFTFRTLTTVAGEQPAAPAKLRFFGTQGTQVTAILDAELGAGASNLAVGEATAAFEGGPVPLPAAAGIVVHAWDLDYTLACAPLP